MAFTLEQMKARRITDSKLEARERILALYPLEIQLSALFGIYNARPMGDPKNPTTMKNAIQAIIDRQNALEAQVNSMNDVDAIDALKFDI